MKNLTKLASALLLAFALSSVAQANPIQGSIRFDGAVTLTTTAGTTSVAFGAPQTVSGALGDYSGVSGTAAFTNFSYTGTGNAALLVGTVLPLWSIPNWSFDLMSLTTADFTGSSFTAQGTGIAHGWGFSDTSGAWSIQGSGSVGVFTLSSNTTAVPDGGMTALMLGLGLLGLGLAARRNKQA